MAAQQKQRLTDDMKRAMKAGEKQRLGVIRSILAAIKQIEVDERIELDDSRVLAVIDKMAKQRRESITAYEAAKRQDLVDVEAAELAVIQTYLPAALDQAELAALIDAAISELAASSMQDMGKVMATLKPQVQGRTDMAKLSAEIKARLA